MRTDTLQDLLELILEAMARSSSGPGYSVMPPSTNSVVPTT
jgi:hypothetical protein